MLQERFIHHAVNWFDGMSINKDHFIAQENHLLEMRIDAVGQQIQSYNYGLLPSSKAEALIINCEIDARKILNVEIQNLRAVTLGGARMEITPATLPSLELSVKLKDLVHEKETDGTFALVLSVNPYGREPFGNADPEETPPRKPYIIPQYNLDLIPVKTAEVEIGLYHITLGIIILKNGEFSVSTEYIPPCTSIESSPTLQKFYSATEQSLIELEKHVLRIVQKVRNKQQKNTLAQAIGDVSENLLNFLSHQLPAFALYLRESAPVFCIEKVIALARITQNSIESWQGNGKEELFNYLREWCDLDQGLWDKTLNELTGLRYQHHNTALAIKKVEKYLNTINSLFGVLAELDYIGKKIDTNLFVTEEVAEPVIVEKQQRKGWFKNRKS